MKRPLRGIVVLEGADCSGKTTLARHLVERHGARYLHGRVFPDMWRYHAAMTRLALRWADAGLVVIDRLWLSELIYGETYRGGPAYDLGARCLDRVLQRAGAVTVVCSPSDQETQLAKHAARSEAGREAFVNVRAVVAAYADLVRGNLARPGDGYLGQLIRYGNFATRPDVYVYDLDLTGHDLPAVTDRIVMKLRARRFAQLPAGLDSRRYNLVGHAGTARVLFVGERVSPRYASRLKPPHWPFIWHDGLSAATYLNRALHALGWDETRGLWTNALSEDDQLATLLERPLRVVALGQVAADRARTLARDPREVRTVPHPQYWRRFHHARFDEYVDLLREAVR